MTARELMFKAEEIAAVKNCSLKDVVIELAQEDNEIEMTAQEIPIKDKDLKTIGIAGSLKLIKLKDGSEITSFEDTMVISVPAENLTDAQKEKLLTKLQAQNKGWQFLKWENDSHVLVQHTIIEVSTPAENLTEQERELFSKEFRSIAGLTSGNWKPWTLGKNWPIIGLKT
ncbi:MAG: hypothetical protein A2097_07140 [Desulfobacula sp. GWF2_41_7]|nr:MAG: hypothetical protein A2097_07140 [Desulfobacula sp. GWF2_41_7]